MTKEKEDLEGKILNLQSTILRNSLKEAELKQREKSKTTINEIQ